MPEPGPDPLRPKSKPAGAGSETDGKIGNDDLMAIFGGVVSKDKASVSAEPPASPATPVPVAPAEPPAAPKPQTSPADPLRVPPSVLDGLESLPEIGAETPATPAPVPQTASAEPSHAPVEPNAAPKPDLSHLGSLPPLETVLSAPVAAPVEPSVGVPTPAQAVSGDTLLDGVSDSEPDVPVAHSTPQPPPPPLETPKAESAAPSLEAAQVAPAPTAESPEAKPAELGNVHLPPSLQPPGLKPGALFVKPSAPQGDPLGLFAAGAAATNSVEPASPAAPAPEKEASASAAAPVEAPSPATFPKLHPMDLPPMPAGTPSSTGKNLEDPLSLFKSVPASKAPETVPADVPAGRVPQVPAASASPLPPLGEGKALPPSDPLHLFDPKPAAAAPVSSRPPWENPPVAPPEPAPKPPSFAPGAVNAPTPAADPLHLFDGSAPPVPKAASSADLPPFEGLNGTGVPPKDFSAPPPPRPRVKLAQEEEGEDVPFFQELKAKWVQKTHVPMWAWTLLLVLIALGIAGTLAKSFIKPPVQLTDSLPALHPTRTDVKEVVGLDITSYLDLDGKVKQLGFGPLVGLSVPEIPSPNFLSVYVNTVTKTYAVLVMRPGLNKVSLSFVNTLSTGTWLSTNGWDVKGGSLEKLDSESAPQAPPAALWALHQKRLEKALQGGVESTNANQWRFLCALTDHLRWFMSFKDIPAYKAAFEDWF